MHVAHRTRSWASPVWRRAPDLTLRYFAQAKHSASRDHEKWQAWFYEYGVPQAGLQPAKASLQIWIDETDHAD